MDRDSLADLPADSCREIVAAVRAVLDVDAATAEDLIRSAEPLWDAMERAGGSLPGINGDWAGMADTGSVRGRYLMNLQDLFNGRRRRSLGGQSSDTGDGSPELSADATSHGHESASDIAAGYVRRMYASNREWYTVAETKAQLLLAANGAFVTILFGVMFGRNGDVKAGAAQFGLETWIFLGVSVVGLVSAITCAAQCLWSMHRSSGEEFIQLNVDPGKPESYRPEVLWYFGHIAHLRSEAMLKALSGADQGFEIQALSYNAYTLSRRVLRKHRWVNAGWAFTALALISLAAAATSFFIRAQL